MAAAAEFATVFLETSLGTRLVISLPASATTVADLKRQVTAEHAAYFPQTGPIAVKSLQMKHDGSLFHLTDSMSVEGAFRCIKGPWNLLVDAHELRSRPLAGEDVYSGSCGSEQNAGNPVVRESTQNMSSPVVSEGDGDLAIGDGVSDIPLLNQLDQNHEDVERASHQLEDENTVPLESSDIYLSAGGSVQECPDLYLDAGGSDNPVGLQDKLCQGVKHASGQPEDGNLKTMLQGNSDLNSVAVESDPRAKNQLDKSHKDVEHVMSLCKDGNVKTMLQENSERDVAVGEGDNLAQEKSRRIEQESLNSNPLVYNQGSCSHGMGERPSRDEKETWKSGKSSGEGPLVTGLSSGESSFKETDGSHRIKSMKDGNKRPALIDQFIKKRKYEGATSTTSTEQESCFIRRRVLSMRKLPMSKAAKIYGLRY